MAGSRSPARMRPLQLPRVSESASMSPSPLRFGGHSVQTLYVKDLGVSFFDFADTPRQLMLLRTPAHEQMLPMGERGVRCTLEAEEIGFLAAAAWHESGVRLRMREGREVEVDTTGTAQAYVHRAMLVMELMNADGMLDVTGSSPSDEERVELLLDRLDSDDAETVRTALREAHASRELLADALLEVIEDLDVEYADESSLPTLAFYLLASWKDRRAMEPLVRFFERGGETASDAFGDVVPQDLPGMLLSFAHGDFAPVRGLLENRSVSVWVRDACMRALACAAAAGDLPVDEVEAYFEDLAARGLLDDDEQLWAQLAILTADLASERLLPLALRAWDEGRVDAMSIGRDELLRDAARDRATAFAEMSRSHRIDVIADPVEATSWWSLFSAGSEPRDSFDAGEDDAAGRQPGWWLPPATVRNPPKVGRNEPCPCGSGKKNKKCCGG